MFVQALEVFFTGRRGIGTDFHGKVDHGSLSSIQISPLIVYGDLVGD